VIDEGRDRMGTDTTFENISAKKCSQTDERYQVKDPKSTSKQQQAQQIKMSYI
jgi:hypothetical protein